MFEHTKGVISATSGFATPTEESVSPGPASSRPTTYAEAVRVVYDSTQITYAQLLQIFFLVAHDPTQLDRQGPDVGAEYRSLVFVSDSAQQTIVGAYVDSLQAARIFRQPIVTEIVQLKRFREAEDYHQDYVVHHPDAPYVLANDVPKLAEFRRQFPGLYHS